MVRRRRTTPVYAGRGGVHREEKSILFGGARRRRFPRLRSALAAAVLAAVATAAIASEVQGRVAGDPPRSGPPAPEATPTPDAAPEPEATPDPLTAESADPLWPEVRWRRSRAIGKPYAGRLRRGVRLPRDGEHFFTWDPIGKHVPNRPWRRWGTDGLVRVVLDVAAAHRLENPGAARVGIGDLSRRRGGSFGVRFGGLGHLSHQNGLDVDVYYPRLDGRERRPYKPSLVDRRLAQDLVDRFVAAGAVKVFVGPRLDLEGPRGIVVPLAHHDDHLHARLP